MQSRYLYLLRYILPVTDILMLNLAYFMAYYLTGYLGKLVSYEVLRQYVVLCNLIWLFNGLLFGLYSEHAVRQLERIYRATWRSILLHFVLFSLYLLFEKNVSFSRTFIIVFYTLLLVCSVLNRFLGTAFQMLLVNKLHGNKKVAVMGVNPTGSRLVEYLKKQHDVNFYGLIPHQSGHTYDDQSGLPSGPLISGMEELAACGVTDLYVSVAPEKLSKIYNLMKEADKQCLRLKFIMDLTGTLTVPYTISYMGGEFPVINLRNEPLEEMSNRFKKRLFDVVFSSLVIIFILSWMYPLIALLIKIQGGGAVLFKQLRSGKNDNPFWCYKFRSMRPNAESDYKQAIRNDDRVTPIGRFLRKTNLDEIPQFINVLMGDMSVVGPRPHMLTHTEKYKAIVSQYMVRQFLKPGITGWAQVNGYRGETREYKDMENRVKYDIFYLENWSAMFDVKIIFMTLINVLRGEDNAF